MDIYNPQVKDKERIDIASSAITMYSCGPTIFKPPFLGHWRAYLNIDLLTRTLQYLGYSIDHAMGITDILNLEKIDVSKRKKEFSIESFNLGSLSELSDKILSQFKREASLLNVFLPRMRRTSECIDDQIAFLERLLERRLAYISKEGLFFDSSSLDLGPDFALWIFSDHSRVMEWDSQWGRGLPTWDLSCAVVGKILIGDQVDIRTGGISYMNKHHKNERILLESLTNVVPRARYRFYNEFLIVNDEDLGERPTLDQIVDVGIDPLSFRYIVLCSHYRSQIRLTMNALKNANFSLRSLKKRIPKESNGELRSDLTNDYLERFKKTIEDDINTPTALVVAWDTIKSDKLNDVEKRFLLGNYDSIFGLNLLEERKANISHHILSLIKEREAKRAMKQWDAADRIRNEIIKGGYNVQDTPRGTRVLTF